MSPSTSSILRYINRNILENSQNMDEPREKKRRLNHLTWDEKVQRKKLKNRVAAQTSRDRKKARMEQLEAAVQELYAQNERLESDCARLRDENAQLLLRSTTTGTTTCCNCTPITKTLKAEPVDHTTSSMGNVTSPPDLSPSEQISCESRPAESRRFDPLQQGLLFLQLVVLTVMMTLCSPTSRCQNCSSLVWVHSRKTNSCTNCNSWISWPKVYSETWQNSWPSQIQHSNSNAQKEICFTNKQLTHAVAWWGRHQSSWNPPLLSLSA